MTYVKWKSSRKSYQNLFLSMENRRVDVAE